MIDRFKWLEDLSSRYIALDVEIEYEDYHRGDTKVEIEHYIVPGKMETINQADAPVAYLSIDHSPYTNKTTFCINRFGTYKTIVQDSWRYRSLEMADVEKLLETVLRIETRLADGLSQTRDFIRNPLIYDQR